ncbi:MAG: tRNA (N(6)-L-threonylcarbamoyladenosine(37)-C(2))-methylthiotransferase MtaB [Clostridiales Family XIII bacterium]|jgi:threonylcarbamoyladenosine tRNA methylthiotransferase MtaB|nr:tRNA (N(6)-L-threonylcarbamoyladenosine(37)-C(2))-methylthiotransferase MtaB [Clostridiales Family XIII bacterium]
MDIPVVFLYNSVMKIGYATLGCKVNQQETAAIIERFSELGFGVAADGEAADGYIINSCSVTSMADSKTRQRIRQAKRQNPDAVVAVIGCYVGVHEAEAEAMPEVDIVINSENKDEIVWRMAEALSPVGLTETGSFTDALQALDISSVVSAPEGRTRAYIKVEDGCDRFCSYCIIPIARGQVRSRPKAEIIGEVENLVRKGYKEIVITGINTALYGRDFGAEDEILALISDISEIDGDFRIRLGSLEPTVINAELARRLVKIPKLCPHLHLSLQSGSDRVLKEMGRKYSRQEYLDIVSVLRESDLNFAISTDIIVGFPGETDEDFQDSIDMVRQAKFSKVHVFKYSMRPGTKAAELTGQVPEEVKKKRSLTLTARAEEIANEFNLLSVGQARQTLILGVGNDGRARGITDNGIELVLLGEYKENTFADIIIEKEDL